MLQQLRNAGLGTLEDQYVYIPAEGQIICEGNVMPYGPQKNDETGKYTALTMTGIVEYDAMPTKFEVNLDATTGALKFCGVDKATGNVTSFGPVPKPLEGTHFRLACAVATTAVRVHLESGPGVDADASDRVHKKAV